MVAEHKEKISRLSKQIASAKMPIKINHGSTNSTRSQPRRGYTIIDTSNLNQILEINIKENYAIVEPNVSFGKLVDETLKFGLMPKVVTEFPEITIGGAVQGGAGESSSFRFGGFHQICDEYELILSNGDVLIANKQQNTDVFYGTVCSYGSLAVLGSIKLQLMPTPGYVELVYERVSSSEELLARSSKYTKENIDFLDAILYSKNFGVICTGKFTENRNVTARFSRFHDEWFYIHAKNKVTKSGHHVDIIPIKDYLFRYDRGAFWMAKYGFKIYKFPFNKFTRVWFSSILTTRMLYKYLHGSGLSKNYLIQDNCMPLQTVGKFIADTTKEFDIYPLWVCPLKPDDKSFLASNHLHTDIVINIGVWGELRDKSHKAIEQSNIRLEEIVNTYEGRKVFYSQNYYSERDFWGTYDEEKYKKLRAKYKAETKFIDVFKKVTYKEYRPINHIKGWKAFLTNPYR